MALLIGSSAIGMANSMYTYYHDGILYTLAGFLIPFVEKRSTMDTVLNVFYQLLAGIVAFFGLSCVHN